MSKSEDSFDFWLVAAFRKFISLNDSKLQFDLSWAAEKRYFAMLRTFGQMLQISILHYIFIVVQELWRHDISFRVYLYSHSLQSLSCLLCTTASVLHCILSFFWTCPSLELPLQKLFFLWMERRSNPCLQVVLQSMFRPIGLDISCIIFLPWASHWPRLDPNSAFLRDSASSGLDFQSSCFVGSCSSVVIDKVRWSFS